MSSPQPLIFFEKGSVYPRSIKGKLRNIKYGILALAYAVYFLLPYLRWERAPGLPDQAIIFDMPHRVYYVFGLTVWPQEIIWLALFLIFAAILLFFVTGLAGRVFCGYFCFQTLWTDLFFIIERWIEGDRNARMRLDQSPWGPRKILLKLIKHVLWIGVAFATGYTFVAYFIDSFHLAREFFVFQAPAPAYVTTFILMATTYTMAGWMREHVCTNVCPYGRFQSVMFDENTQIVAYDTQRGERGKGRTKPSRSLSADARQSSDYGDCIDCGLCVQVCPTGIDIRNGLQYQCISCGLCIDACNSVMESVKLPQGLIRYTSENALAGKPVRWFTPKTMGYMAALSLVLGIFIYSLSSRSDMRVDVQQERQPLYVELSDGSIQNKYYIKVTNKSLKTGVYALRLKGLPQAKLNTDTSSLEIAPGKTGDMTAFVKMLPAQMKEARQTFAFVVSNSLDKDDEKSYQTDFYAPVTVDKD